MEEELYNSTPLFHNVSKGDVFRVLSRWIPLFVVVFFGVAVITYFVASSLGYGTNLNTPNGKPTFNGAGSLTTSTLMTNLLLGYGNTNASISFNPTSSSEGVQEVLEGEATFAVASYFDESLSSDIVILPFAVTGAAIIYGKSDTFGGDLNVGREDITGIYLGMILSWQDHHWNSINNNSLPSLQVHPLHRTDNDGNSASSLFLDSLSSFNPDWPKPAGHPEIPWPVSNYAPYYSIITADVMMSDVSQSAGSLGYVPYPLFMNSSFIGTVLSANLENQQGQFVGIDLNSLSTTRDSVILTVDTVRDAAITDRNCSGCYPMTGFEYILFNQSILTSNCTEAKQFASFLSFLYSEDADQIKLSAGFATLNQTGNELIQSMVNQTTATCADKTFPLTIYELAIVVGSLGTLILLVIVVIVKIIQSRTQKRATKMRDVTSTEETDNLLTRAPEDIQPSIKIDNDQLIFKRKIGRGSFSEVFLGVFRGTEVAIKKVYTTSPAYTYSNTSFQREINLMSQLRHPKVVLFMGACFAENTFYIVTEYCSRGSLHDIIYNKQNTFDFQRQLQMSIDAAAGVVYLHERVPKIIHRDIKSSNFLVDKDWNVKVSDFGLSTVLMDNQRMMTGNMGTVEYMAIECLKGEPYTEKADVYSFGIVLYELFTREELYEGLTVVQIRFLVRTQDLRPAFKTPLPTELQKLIEKCWDYDPAVRPTMSEVLGSLSTFQSDPTSLGVFSAENQLTLPSIGNAFSNNNNNNNNNNENNSTNNNTNSTPQTPSKFDRFQATFSTPNRKNSKTAAVPINNNNSNRNSGFGNGNQLAQSAPNDSSSRVFSSV